VLLPDVNRSGVDFEIEDDAIRTGFGCVRDLGRKTRERIIAERGEGRFTSLQDFLIRVAARKEEVESLIGCGAFDEVEPDRCQALARYFSTRGRASFVEEPVLGLEIEQDLFPVANATDLRRRRMEYDVLGFSPLAHPLEFFDTSVQESLGLKEDGDDDTPDAGTGSVDADGRWQDSRHGARNGGTQQPSRPGGDDTANVYAGGARQGRRQVSAHGGARTRRSAPGRRTPNKEWAAGRSDRTAARPGSRRARRPNPRRATCTGVLAAKRYHKGTREPIYFLTLDYPEGLTECVAPARVVKVRLKYGQAYTVTGTAQNRYGVTTLKVDSVTSLPESNF
jgi:hypothetical protein